MFWTFVAFAVVLVVVLVVPRVAKGLGGGEKGRGQVPVPYYAKRMLFTPAERSFLGVLERALEGRYRVFGKVRLIDLLGVKRGLNASERTSANNRVMKKHVDFVLCRQEDFSVVALIELDDASHARPNRRARDAFLERACNAAGHSLLRMPVKQGYTLEEVRRLLQKIDATEMESA